MLGLVVLLLLQLSVGRGLLPAQVESVVAPVPPRNALAGGCVLAVLPVDTAGRVGSVSLLEKAEPYNDVTTAAAKQWRFRPAMRGGQVVESTVGLLAMFRPSAFGSFAVGGPSLGYSEPAGLPVSHPPLPLSLSDPGYPPSGISVGVVILELTIDTDGRLTNIRTVQDVPQLTQPSRESVQSWKFLPASEAGQPVNGSLIVAISYLAPVIPQPQ